MKHSRDIYLDGILSGTGIRDIVHGGYIELSKLPLKKSTQDTITKWLSEYEDQHYEGFENTFECDLLDKRGLLLALAISEELEGYSVRYFSSYLLKELS